ncbi:MAG: hypothetical protein GX931_03770 [Acholeplasmataceae bacterium]|jgi:N-acetylglucosamine kinase-like BadF-type ATPase|nr:hypothetical protein [Acholeplasmataceae bacterium]
MYDYIVAIDGGGTKTAGILYSLDGKELRHALKGFSNFAIDEATAKKNIYALIDELLQSLNYNKVYIQMGIAGTSKLFNKERFLKDLENRYRATANLVTDALICLYAIERKSDETLIMAIGGTGSVVLIEKEGKIERMGGWGHILGDEGSAYHLAIEAIKNIIYEYEHSIPYSVLSKHLLKVMEIENIFEIIEYVYNRDKSTIAKLSLEIQKIAKTDPYARTLLEKEGLLLGKQIVNAYKRFIKDESVVISLRGSFVLKALYVKEVVLEELNKNLSNFRVDFEGNEPVYGAYVLAKLNIEKGE